MPALTKKSNNVMKTPESVANIIVRRSQQGKKRVPMLTETVVPAGTYHSVVVAVEDAHSDEGKPMVDVTYRFTDARGKETEARMRYPITGYHLEKVIDAWLDAGLPEGSHLTDAVGLEEEVVIVYPQQGALGKIKSRRPVGKATKTASKVVSSQKTTHRVVDDTYEEDFAEDEPAEDFDDEFYDFLEDSD